MVILEDQQEKKTRYSVLVVDDDPEIGQFMLDCVERLGHEVEGSNHPHEALDSVAKKNYDIVVTDLRMPDMDGLTLLKRIKTLNDDTEVIVITGYASVENALDCINAGAVDYLVKPFSVEQVQVALVKTIRHMELKALAKERERYLEMSYEDALTGVYNRRFFDEALKLEIIKSSRQENPFCLLMIDVDHFKNFNDSYGHQMGDEALVKLGKAFKSVCRGYDIVTRYGGEEFAIIFPGASKEMASIICHRLMNEVANVSEELPNTLLSGKLTISIGVACFPNDARTGRQLIERADISLYEAKRSGRNNYKIYGMF
ncbi:MAG: diguanylate cyclase [Deltaproteobacteria bacterium]|nr:diguanylate cyclase [Deltaproteobacteria bacterium]